MELNEFVDYLYDNIYDTNTANLMKIRNYMKIKDTDEGYDLYEFFTEFTKRCVKAAKEDDNNTAADIARVTIRARHDMQKNTKSFVFDMWLFDVLQVMK